MNLPKKRLPAQEERPKESEGYDQADLEYQWRVFGHYGQQLSQDLEDSIDAMCETG